MPRPSKHRFLGLALHLLLWTTALGPVDAAEAPRTRISTGPEGLEMSSAPPSPQARQRLEDWYALYRRVGDPARRTAAACFETSESADEPGGRDRRLHTCRELARWVLALTEAEVPQAPHFAVRRHVQTAVARLGAAATACLTHRGTAARVHWSEARRAFAEADRMLARLGL